MADDEPPQDGAPDQLDLTEVRVEGLMLQVAVGALTLAGQTISSSMGLSMATLIDPSVGNVPVIAQFIVLMSTLVFLGFGGHVIMLSMVLDSFKTIPIGQSILGQVAFGKVVAWSSMIFLGGVLISLPVSVLGARNLMPAWVTWPARVVMIICRSFHPVIIAILFVQAVGFGALAGILALTVAAVGFLGKLFTEAIEEISLKQVEAIRATGAHPIVHLGYLEFPQSPHEVRGAAAGSLAGAAFAAVWASSRLRSACACTATPAAFAGSASHAPGLIGTAKRSSKRRTLPSNTGLPPNVACNASRSPAACHASTCCNGT